MLKDLVQYLFEKGQEANETTVEEFPNDPDKRLVIGPNGGHTTLETPRLKPPVTEICYTVDDFATRIGDAPADAELEPQVWYDEGSATVFSTDRFRDHRITIEFPHHPILHRIRKLASSEWHTQQSAVRLLRVDLAGLAEEHILARFRQLNWESVKRVRQTIKHSSSSLDAEVASQVTSDAEIPEQFAINVPLFANPVWNLVTCRLIVVIELDPDNCKIGLQLVPGSLELIQQEARNAIHRFLSDAVDMDAWTLVCGRSNLVEKQQRSS